MIVHYRSYDHFRFSFRSEQLGINDQEAGETIAGCGCVSCGFRRQVVLDEMHKLRLVKTQGEC